MRCFVAVDLPEDVRAELRKMQAEIRKAGNDCGIKASFSKEHHLTLKFFGDITPDRVHKAEDSLNRCRIRKFSVSLHEIGFFPDESRPRVIWIGIRPEDEMNRLQRQVDESLQKHFKKEHNFKAHATLARIKRLDNREKFLQKLKEMKFEKKIFEVRGFRLLYSTLSPEGPVYSEIASYQA